MLEDADVVKHGHAHPGVPQVWALLIERAHRLLWLVRGVRDLLSRSLYEVAGHGGTLKPPTFLPSFFATATRSYSFCSSTSLNPRPPLTKSSEGRVSM